MTERLFEVFTSYVMFSQYGWEAIGFQVWGHFISGYYQCVENKTLGVLPLDHPYDVKTSAYPNTFSIPVRVPVRDVTIKQKSRMPFDEIGVWSFSDYPASTDLSIRFIISHNWQFWKRVRGNRREEIEETHLRRKPNIKPSWPIIRRPRGSPPWRMPSLINSLWRESLTSWHGYCFNTNIQKSKRKFEL